MEVLTKPIPISTREVVRKGFVFHAYAYRLTHAEWLYLTQIGVSEVAVGAFLSCFLTTAISFFKEGGQFLIAIEKIKVDLVCEFVFFIILMIVAYFKDGLKRKIKKDISNFFIERM